VYFSNYTDPVTRSSTRTKQQVLARYEPFHPPHQPAFDRSWIQGTWLFKDRAGQPIVHARYHEVIPRCVRRPPASTSPTPPDLPGGSRPELRDPPRAAGGALVIADAAERSGAIP
jgi:hypothetical protein